MDYKTATDLLLDKVTTDDLAQALGASQNAVVRARLDPDTRSWRPPPPGWPFAIARLARERGGELLRLAEELEGGE